MISVGRRDARKELGLGFGGGEREMDDTELEEGEAWSYHNNANNDDFDASIDPDNDLSYIDEKLQNVLGHFQKNFEGGVSAENLGAIFGGYGSFLPAYQRSPVLSHERKPSKVLHNYASRSPNSLQPEGGGHSSISLSNAPQSVRIEPSAGVLPMGVLKASSSHVEATKQKGHVPPVNFSEAGTTSKKSANLSDQKMLKVRIKMGSDNLTRKNAEIYSGLGLDGSPSSSIDDSPSEVEGMSHEPQEALSRSPFHILQIMSSFPVHGAFILSPLPDDLIHLKEKEFFPKNSGSWLATTVGQESSVIVGNGYSSLKRDRKMLGGKKVTSLSRNEVSAECKYENSKASHIGVDDLSTKGIEPDSSACEELVSNTLKLPLLSSSDLAVGDTIKGMGKPGNMHILEVQDKDFSDLRKEEPLMPMFTQENDWIDSYKSTDAAKLAEDEKSSAIGGDSVHLRKDKHCQGEKHLDLVKLDPNVLKGRKRVNDVLADPPKQISDKKAVSCEQEGVKFPPVKIRSSSEGKKKSKGSQSKGKIALDASKGSFRVGMSSLPKNKKSTCGDGSTTKGESEDCKSHKGGKARDRYKDFFGDIEPEQEENHMSPSERSHGHRSKDSSMDQRTAHATTSAYSGRSASNKVDKLTTSEGFPGAFPTDSHRLSNAPITANAFAAPVPVMEEDNWVCCDKCQTWRLLPPGTNPIDLPEKWVCSMLDWLPGMNRCSFSEEETSLATRVHFFSNPGGIMPEVASAPVQNPQSVGLDSLLAGGKKKPSSKEFRNLPLKGGPALLSNSAKKSISNGSLNDLNPSPVISEPGSLKLSKSAGASLEKHKHKIKEKHRVLDKHSDGGGSKQSMLKGKIDSDQDYSQASKKIRTEDWSADHGGVASKVDPSTTNGLPKLSSGKNVPYCNVRTSSKESQCDVDQVQISSKKPKEFQISLDSRYTDTGKGSDTVKDATKKRKFKESCDTQIYPNYVIKTGNHLLDSAVMKNSESTEGHCRKDKKPRLSRSEGKEGNGSKGNCRTDKKFNHRKNQQPGKNSGSTLSQRSLDGSDSLKRESGSMPPSLAATSSSSKVSGSHRTRSNLNDVKGSPVESVSSSPMRVLNPDKLTSSINNTNQRDDSTNAGVISVGSLRRLSDAEDDHGSNQSGTARKEKLLDVAHRGSLESSVLDFQEDLKPVSGKAKGHIVPSSDIANHHLVNGGAEFVDQDASYPHKMTALDQCHGDGVQSARHHQMNGSRPKKYGKGSSSRSKEKGRNFASVIENGKVVDSDSFNAQAPLCEAKPTDGKFKNDEMFRVKSDQNENRYIDEKDREHYSGAKREDLLNIDEDSSGADVKVDAICDHEALFMPKKIILLDRDMGCGGRKSISSPPMGRAQDESLPDCQLISGSHKINETNIVPVSGSDGVNESKPLKQSRKVDCVDGIHHNNSDSKTGISNGHRARDLDAPSPVKRDSSSHAATNALKEATNVKHLADRLKNFGSNLESTRLYFEAALKFLHGALLLETSSSDNARTGEMMQSMQVYSSTAKLCEFCAHEYEKSKDMASAALAYKCMEVAYMRVIYSSHANANRDRSELQMALQLIPPGESPSSSASDIDNLNHPTTADKVPLPKGVSSPHVPGSHIIAAKNRPNFVRLLTFAQDVNFAMEASRKSLSAFAVANASLREASGEEGISSIKTALDFNFQDVEGFLRLVRLAIEAIGR